MAATACHVGGEFTSLVAHEAPGTEPNEGVDGLGVAVPGSVVERGELARTTGAPAVGETHAAVVVVDLVANRAPLGGAGRIHDGGHIARDVLAPRAEVAAAKPEVGLR